jgi:hypothetical protein
MPLLMMAKAKWTLFGIEAPQFIWIAAAVLLVGTLLQIVRLWWLVSGEKALYRHIMTQLEAIRLEYGVRRQEGLAQAAYEAVVQVFDEQPPLVPAWHNFDMQMLGQSNAEGQQHMWGTESAASAFNATTVIEPRLNQSFFAAVPGMVTGIGLLCTFVAILVALLDVRLVEGQFQGLDNLISGLSGKFLSSIAALFAATCFLAVEQLAVARPWYQSARPGHDARPSRATPVANEYSESHATRHSRAEHCAPTLQYPFRHQAPARHKRRGGTSPGASGHYLAGTHTSPPYD